MLKFLSMMLMWPLQLLAVAFMYWLLSLGMVLLVRPYWPQYDEYSAVTDTQGMLLVLLLWDRFWGPTSRMFNRVGKSLLKAQRKKKAQ